MGARLMQPSLGQTRNGAIPQLRDVLRGERSFGARRPAAVARRGFVERVRAAALDSILPVASRAYSKSIIGVGALAPKGRNVNDYAVDEVLRRHRCR